MKLFNSTSTGFILRFALILLTSFGVIAAVDYYQSRESALPAAAVEK